MPRKKSTLQTALEYYGVRLLLGIVGAFPYRVSLQIGECIGILFFHAFSGLRKTALRNLELAFPANSSDKNRKLARETYRSLGRHIGFFSHFPKFEKADIRELIEVRGKDKYFEARKEGRGILFFTGHFGSWEVFNLLAPAFEEEMNILVRRLDNERVEKYVDSLRTKFGSVTLGKRGALRQLYRLLENGKTLGILADLNAQHRDGVFVDFFGIPAATTKSIAKLVIKTQPFLFPAFAVWDKDAKRYRVHVEDPIEYELTGDKEADILSITKKFTKSVEDWVRRHPEQWLWTHKRWKTRPPGEKSLY